MRPTPSPGSPRAPQEGIDFDKTDLPAHLTSFLYPDDSDEAGRLLRVYQQSRMMGTSWGATFSMKVRGHFSSASARMVWLV